MDYSLVLLTAGRSERFAGGVNKVFYMLGKKRVIDYSLELFTTDKDCKEVIIVYNNDNEENINLLKKEYQGSNLKFVIGGDSRSASVLNGLKACDEKYVLIHDGARPVITMNIIENVKKELEKYDAVAPAVKCTDTIKSLDNEKIKTLDRSKLYQMQTPQGVKRDLLIESLTKSIDESFYDDLQAIEKVNGKVCIVQGDKKNIKLTTKEDLQLIKYYLNLNKPVFRIGSSSDIHAFCDNKDLFLGCVKIDYDKGLLAHSDGDCLVHAIVEAIIGALGLGDIGKHFPDKDPKYKNINSSYFLEKVRDLLNNEGYSIVNIDSLVLIEEPMLGRYIDEMKERIAYYLQIDKTQINIKATRGEKLGFVGKKKGVEARASVLIEKDPE